MTEVRAAPPLDDRLAADLRGFGPVGLLAMLVILAGNFVVAPLSAILVLAWAHRSRTPWREIGFVRPPIWIRDIAVGIALGVAFKFLMKSIVMPLLGADPVNQAYHYVAGNPAALPAMLYAVIIGAGFGEETLFRGYLFERLGKLFGTTLAAKIAIVAITSLGFAVAHFTEQGVAGVEQAIVTGLALGTVFAWTRSLWPVMAAHATYDLVALLIIYANLEDSVAHLVFH